jgi:formylglycine-generating enzyme required for sulfatase activity
MLAPGTILQNRYRILREIGHGGMGTVYEALDQRVNSIVALKETLAMQAAQARTAFEREAALLANLRHQGLPKVMDFFSEKEGDFLVMEFIPGYDLAELLDLRGSPFPQAQVLRWAYDLLRVLEYLHGHNPPILHRDIKPSNLKLTKHGEIFLLDFGLAKGAAGQMPTLMTSQSLRGYTPVYAALEQITGHGTDARSDLYSLGATLYNLLTGIAPLAAPTRFSALEDEQPDPLPAITELNPQVSAHIAGVIHRAMAITRKQRPISAAEMRKALRNAAEEDERNSAEEEYRRAEARRRELEEEKRRAAEEAIEQAAEDRRLQEAETRKKAEEARRLAEERGRQEEAAERHRQEAERQRRETEEKEKRRAAEAAARVRAEEEERRRRANLPNTIHAQPGPTVPSAEPAPPSEGRLAQPSITTIPAPPPEKLITDREGRFDGDALTPTHAPQSKRALVIVAGVLIVVVVASIVIWSIRGTATQNSPSATEAKPEAAPAKSLESRAPAGMVYVVGGEFKMGRNSGDVAEQPEHQVATVKPFYIDTYEVTNEDYMKFIRASGHRAPSTWRNGSYQPDTARQPVTGVLWEDAIAYAQWAGKRLPTEEEWEFAARGTDGRLYPWGTDWKAGLANAEGASHGMVDVGTYKGTSPFGAYDMVGNAWEWTASNFRAYPGGRPPQDLPACGELKVIRGGSYISTKDYATTTYRTGWCIHGEKTYDQTGFRCVKDVAQ